MLFRTALVLLLAVELGLASDSKKEPEKPGAAPSPAQFAHKAPGSLKHSNVTAPPPTTMNNTLPAVINAPPPPPLVLITGTGDTTTATESAVFANTTTTVDASTTTAAIESNVAALSGELLNTAVTDIVTSLVTTAIIEVSTVTLVLDNNQTITSVVTQTIEQLSTVTEVATQATQIQAIATTIVENPTIIIIQQISIFVFQSALGAVCPAVQNNGQSGFMVGGQQFQNLGQACQSACVQQFTSCAAVAGQNFAVVDCQTQLRACMNAAATATVTEAQPTTITQTVFLPPAAATVTEVVSSALANCGCGVLTTTVLPPAAMATIGAYGISIVTTTESTSETLAPPPPLDCVLAATTITETMMMTMIETVTEVTTMTETVQLAAGVTCATTVIASETLAALGTGTEAALATGTAPRRGGKKKASHGKKPAGEQTMAKYHPRFVRRSYRGWT
jgi:hypothetical protein